jgi:hypothetical protein
MSALSLDYGALVASLKEPLRPAEVGSILANAAADSYQAKVEGACALQAFEQAGARYWFDFASSEDLPQEDRTVAAWAITPMEIHRRDTSYQRGFPMTPDHVPPVDRGHLIPHLSGGEFGPNIFRQDRALNRGWSEQGKRYRALEREGAGTPGALYFGHLLYADDTAYPSQIEIAVLLPGATLRVDQFANRPGELTAGPQVEALFRPFAMPSIK